MEMRVFEKTGNLAAFMKTIGHRDVKTAMQYQHADFEIIRASFNEASGPVK